MTRHRIVTAPASRTESFGDRERGVLVLGAHHSGIEAIAAALRAGGLTRRRLPQVPRSAELSPLDLAELLLDSLDWAWDAPVAAAPDPAPKRAAAAKHMRAFAAGLRSRWFVADARCSLLLPWMSPPLDDRFVGLLVVRDPVEVARQLLIERGMPLPSALALWRAYHRHLLAGMAGHRLAVVDYAALASRPSEIVPLLLDVLLELGVDGPLDTRSAALAITPDARRQAGPDPQPVIGELQASAVQDYAGLTAQPVTNLRECQLAISRPTNLEVALIEARRTAVVTARADGQTLRTDLGAQRSLVRATRVEAQASSFRAAKAEWRRNRAERASDSLVRRSTTIARTWPGRLAQRWVDTKERHEWARRIAESAITAEPVLTLRWPWWLRQHPLFEADWYVREYPDAVTGRLSAWRHFVRHGIHEGRRPNGLFDLDWYRNEYDEAPKSAPMALDHYLRLGAWEGLNPGPDFDSDWYLHRYVDVALSGMNPLLHYLRHGRDQGRARDAHEGEGLTPAVKGPLARPPAPRVSVVMTTFNSAEFVDDAIRSIVTQDFTDWELIVVDDASRDGTVEVVGRYAQTDRRVRMFTSNRNHGTYWCKNFGLTQARGEFVTFQDSDDMSDTTRLKRQVAALEARPGATAVSTDYVRVSGDGEVLTNRGLEHRRAFISLMFRRSTVLSRIGYFDSVRTSADEEQFERLELAFGPRCVVDLGLPLYRAPVREGALTGTGGSRVDLEVAPEDGSDLAFLSEERRQYLHASREWHASGDRQYVPFPPTRRPFPAPTALWPDQGPQAARAVATAQQGPGSGLAAWTVKGCHEDDLVTGTIGSDIVILSDFRFEGGTSQANIAEIRSLARAGYSIALCQADSTTYRGTPAVHAEVQRLVDQGRARWLSVGERAECRLLVVRHPTVIGRLHELPVRIDADRIVVIVNQVPTDGDGSVHYDVIECQDVMQRVFGRVGTWYPISKAVRETLDRVSGMSGLASEDWHEIINVDSWTADRSTRRTGRPVIGRHSRPSPEKWPADAARIRQVYPTDGSVFVHVLGGADAAFERLGERPDDWTVYEFGELEPKEFLAGLDFFVYYHHDDLIEAFGRTILEALASGLPAILPGHFEATFGEAAIYAEPADVQSVIARLWADREAYESQSTRGVDYVRRHFSYKTHVERTRRLMEAMDVKAVTPTPRHP